MLVDRWVYQKVVIHERRGARWARCAMSLLLKELKAFAQEHENCGELDGGVEGERVWMTCTCGATIIRQVESSFESG